MYNVILNMERLVKSIQDNLKFERYFSISFINHNLSIFFNIVVFLAKSGIKTINQLFLMIQINNFLKLSKNWLLF